MSNDLKNKLEFIDFDISPIGRRIRMVLIKDRASVDYLLKEFNGQPLELSKSNPKTTWQYEGNLFQLSNKLILVDQFEVKKSNPYYMCSTLDDYFFINDNFFVFRNGPHDPAIVEYRIHLDHTRIKEFLSKANVHFIKHEESSNQEIYKTDDNQFIVVESVPNRRTTNENPFKIISDLFVKPEYSRDSLIYIELTMFESFTMMQKSGILANDQEDVEYTESNAYSKRLWLPGSQANISIEAINFKEAEKLIKNLNGAIFPLKFSSEVEDSRRLKDGRILAVYTGQLYLLFNNEEDFERAYDHLKKSVSIQFSNEDIEKLINETNAQLPLNSGKDILKYLNKMDLAGKTLEKCLHEIDVEINKYFWDNLFVEQYFADILGLIGTVLKEHTGGGWKPVRSIGRMVYQPNTGEELDIIPYFLEEAIRQKSTGYCSLVSIVSTLIMSSKLKVGRIFLWNE